MGTYGPYGPRYKAPGIKGKGRRHGYLQEWDPEKGWRDKHHHHYQIAKTVLWSMIA